MTKTYEIRDGHLTPIQFLERLTEALSRVGGSEGEGFTGFVGYFVVVPDAWVERVEQAARLAGIELEPRDRPTLEDFGEPPELPGA